MKETARRNGYDVSDFTWYVYRGQGGGMNMMHITVRVRSRRE